MKNIILYFSLIFAFTAQAQKTDGNAVLQLKIGSQLIYDVSANGKNYQFIATITKLEEGISFDWKMTAPINSNGVVEITREAMETATVLHNFFAEGNTKLTDRTAVFLSKQMWNDAHDEDDMVMISLDSEDETGFFRENTADFAIKTNEKNTALKASNLKSLVDLQEITIWENEKYPLILKMSLGWTIELKEIKN